MVKAKQKRAKCITKYCRNYRGKDHKICHKCRNRKYRALNPVMYVYHNLKTNAKRRGHKFALTFEYFAKWCKENNYINTKGRTRNAATIDKIIDELGYIDGNIQVLTLADNIRKFYVHYRL